MNILIVDDRPLNLRLQRLILEGEGHTVCEAADGVEALAILNREEVDVIISDILMPQMDGYRLCQEVRKSPRLHGLPFIFYTATYTSPTDEKLCMEMGGDKYLQKRATAEALLAAVREVSQNGARRAPGASKSGDDRDEVMKEYNARLVFQLEEKISELHLQTAAMENAANAIVITDPKGHILRVNPAFTLLSGYPAEEVIGQTPRLLKSGHHEQPFYRDLWRTILSGQTWRGEFINRRKDGSHYHGEQTITPVRDQSGTITHFIGIMNDVTEQKRAEEALRAREHLMRLVMDLVPHHIFAKDAKGRHLFVNRACAAAHGITPQQMVGLTNLELGAPQSEVEAIMRDDREIISNCQTKVIPEEQLTDHIGQKRYYQTIKMPFAAPNTGGPGVLGVGVDITERKRAEDEARRSLDLLRAVSDGTTDAVFVKDGEGKYLLFNEAASRFVGRPVSEVIGQDDMALFDAEGARQVMANDRAVRDSGVSQTDEERLTAAGVARTYLATKSPYRDTQGNIIGTIGISHDITQRKRLELELRESERRFTDMMSKVELLSLMLDRDACITYANDYLLQLTGWEREELIGHSFSELFIPQELEGGLKSLFDELLADSPPAWHHENEILTRSGERLLIQWNNSVLRSLSGDVIGTASIGKNITARKRAEAALKESELRLREVVENIREVFWMAELDLSTMIYVSPAYEAIWGRTCESLLASPTGWADAIHPDDRERAFKACATKAPLGTYDEEYRIARPDGAQRWIRDRGFPVKDENGRVYRIAGTAEDITERKKLEGQFLRAQRMESIGTLAGGIAHDLNNVLGPIVLAVDLLALKFTDTASADMIGIIRTSAQRGVDMVRQVLSFARGLEGRRMEVQVKHLVHDIQKIANDTFLKHIQMQTDLPKDLWTVLGDPTQLHQVLLNLCVNARDAMPTGGTLSFTAENLQVDAQYAALTPEAHPGPYVVLQVEDSGTGMPPELLEKIFDPFFTTKEVGKGTGLGLSTSLAIVKSHGGFIRVSSELGKGSIFRIYLPAQFGVATAAPAESKLEMPRGNGELILVVDDEVSVRLITQQTLEAFGYRVVLASDGAEAVAIYASSGAEIAVVMTDMMMPTMDGAATIQVLRKINPKVRIIAASGLSANSGVSSVPSLGIKHFLAKPFTADTLLKLLQEVLTVAE